MKINRFKNGDIIPSIGLGTFLAKPNETMEAILTALNEGYRHIDCAAIYGNEAEIGEALETAFNKEIVTREEIFITSKLWNDCHDPENVEPALRKTLADLRVNYLDLYLIHWPLMFKHGVKIPSKIEDLVSYEELPLSETWKKMIEMKERGLVKHIGVSNFSQHKILELFNNTGVMPEMNQVEIHPYFSQAELVAFCQSHDILVTAYAPLGGEQKNNPDKSLIEDKTIKTIAATHNATPAQVLVAWGLQREIIEIPKSVKPHRIIENLKSQDVVLTTNDMLLINELTTGIRTGTGSFGVIEGGPITSQQLWD